MVSAAKIASGSPQGKPSGAGELDLDKNVSVEDDEPVEDNDEFVQGLSQVQIQVLAQKIYDLMLDELRIEEERYGRRSMR